MPKLCNNFYADFWLAGVVQAADQFSISLGGVSLGKRRGGSLLGSAWVQAWAKVGAKRAAGLD